MVYLIIHFECEVLTVHASNSPVFFFGSIPPSTLASHKVL